MTPDDTAIVTIAIHRCRPDRPPPTRTEVRLGLVCHPVLQVALVHQLVLPDATEPLPGLASVLREQVRTLQAAHATALRHALAHHRLRVAYADATRDALTDPLTGLPNRRAVQAHLRETAADARGRAAVALIDLDGFKTVNDRHSHLTGDAVLRTVADCLRRSLRGQDMLARIGGDEFLAILPATSLREAARTLARAAASVASRRDVLGVTTSIGIAALPSDNGIDAALAAADTALYRAKDAGGNAVAVNNAVR